MHANFQTECARVVNNCIAGCFPEEQESGKYPGLAVALLDEGRPIYESYFGKANLELDVDVTEISRFHVASLSKQFVGALVAMAEYRGLLGVNDYVSDLVPRYSAFGRRIKIIDLLLHRNGLPDIWSMMEWAGWRGTDLISENDIEKLVLELRSENISPTKFRYSNTGYYVLAQVLESVYGSSIADLAQHQIFEPLSMNETLFRQDIDQMVPGLCFGYSRSDCKIHQLYNRTPSLCVPGPTSLITTLEDYGKWESEIVNPSNIPSAVVKRLHSNLEEGALGNKNYSWGVAQIQNEWGCYIGHSGRDFGSTSIHLRNRISNTSCVVFANSDCYPVWDLAFELCSLVDKKISSNFPQPVDRTIQENSKSINVVNRTSIDGVYSSSEGAHILLTGDTANLVSSGYSTMSFESVDGREYIGAKNDLGLSFKEARGYTRFNLSSRFDDVEFRRIPINADGVQFESGVFYCRVLNTYCSVEWKDQVMTIEFPKHQLRASKVGVGKLYVFSDFWCTWQGNSLDAFELGDARTRKIQFNRL